ncbi:DNA adenine methylase [Patescibacteria group bacterium]|uniref:site-specific DNA-methyltransferase (adenine-specific) n=1 Tax=candidate division WWE3 bacterium TaxID=2053526 RepID=A0A928Y4E9_UNCKA|nr:DNA adenine methylase [candidate division WWE3 bacterium]MCL4733187.1 DNA adenine methylase [Patescibacteria group bacterium]
MQKINREKISGFSSPLRYPGGKTRLANKLLEAIEKNFDQKEKVILVEPYAGGAGASLTLLFAGKVEKIVINDLDRAIFTFWKIAVSDTNYLINKIRRTEVTIKEWKKQKAIYISTKNERKLAFATLFLNRTNRSGIMNGGPIGGIDQSGAWKVNARFTKKTIIDRLEKIKESRNKIDVCNLDGIELLKKLEERKNRKQYFIFLDPPYFQKGQSLYLNHYNKKDHENLSEFLEKSAFKKWVMTYDNVPYIKNLYATMRTRGFAIQHNAYESKIGREVMIFSDALAK